VIMVSPPVGFMDFGAPRPDPRVRLVLVGDFDDFAKVDAVRDYTAGWNPGAQFTVVPGADHFYAAHCIRIRTVLGTFLDD
jgi:alpha/beta superfamily hydrolase